MTPVFCWQPPFLRRASLCSSGRRDFAIWGASANTDARPEAWILLPAPHALSSSLIIFRHRSVIPRSVLWTSLATSTATRNLLFLSRRRPYRKSRFLAALGMTPVFGWQPPFLRRASLCSSGRRDFAMWDASANNNARPEGVGFSDPECRLGAKATASGRAVQFVRD